MGDFSQIILKKQTLVVIPLGLGLLTLFAAVSILDNAAKCRILQNGLIIIIFWKDNLANAFL